MHIFGMWHISLSKFLFGSVLDRKELPCITSHSCLWWRSLFPYSQFIRRSLAPGKSKFSACQSAFLLASAAQANGFACANVFICICRRSSPQWRHCVLIPSMLRALARLCVFVFLTAGTCSVLTTHIGHYCRDGCIMQICSEKVSWVVAAPCPIKRGSKENSGD